MPLANGEVEHGAIKQQNEKVTENGMTVSQDETISPERSSKDVVTPKTWLVVAASLPCPTSASSELLLTKVRRSPLAMDLHILQCRA